MNNIVLSRGLLDLKPIDEVHKNVGRMQRTCDGVALECVNLWDGKRGDSGRDVPHRRYGGIDFGLDTQWRHRWIVFVNTTDPIHVVVEHNVEDNVEYTGGEPRNDHRVAVSSEGRNPLNQSRQIFVKSALERSPFRYVLPLSEDWHWEWVGCRFERMSLPS